MSITVRLAEPFRDGVGAVLIIDQPVRNLGELVVILEKRIPSFAQGNNELFNFAVNGALVLHNEKAIALKPGDEVELLIAFSGG